MSAAVQHEARVSTPETSGKEVTLTKGANASAAMAAHSFEQRCSQGGTSQ
jgi:hypothetical protein